MKQLLIPCCLAVALLAGCAIRAPQPDVAWSAEQSAAMTRFMVHGKVGFRRGESGGSAALVWKQDGSTYDLLATGPLGQGATQIQGNAGWVRIASGKEVRESNTPETLLGEALGWPVAIDSLAWWVRGLPAPGHHAEIDYDAEGKPARIRQQDWNILLDRWRASGNQLLPHRLIATGGDSRITLLIERWDSPRHGSRKKAE